VTARASAIAELAVSTVVGAAGVTALWTNRDKFDGHSPITSRGAMLYGIGLCAVLVILCVVGFVSIAVG
jgi:hypothetical protein